MEENNGLSGTFINNSMMRLVANSRGSNNNDMQFDANILSNGDSNAMQFDENILSNAMQFDANILINAMQFDASILSHNGNSNAVQFDANILNNGNSNAYISPGSLVDDQFCSPNNAMVMACSSSNLINHSGQPQSQGSSSECQFNLLYYSSSLMSCFSLKIRFLLV
jgi:hypothetical protein